MSEDSKVSCESLSPPSKKLKTEVTNNGKATAANGSSEKEPSFDEKTVDSDYFG